MRTDNDDLAVYKPVFISAETENGSLHDLRFFRESNYSLSNVTSGASSSLSENKQRTRPLRVLPDVGGLSTVFIPGSSAGFLLKTAASSPHLVRLRGDFTRWMSSFHSPSLNCEHGFIYVDSEDCVRACQLPPDTQFDYPWTLRKIPVEEQVEFLTYSTSSNTYVLGTSSSVGFKLPENDELHPEWRMESMSFLPEVPQSSVKVVSPKTWAVIDTYPLETAEHITAVKNVNLEISENTHERKDLIVVGTAIAKGEDIPSRGCIYVFEVIELSLS